MIIPTSFAQVNLKFTGDALPGTAEVVFGVNITGFPGDPISLGTAVIGAVGDASLDELWVGDVKLSSVLVKYGPNSTGVFGETTADMAGTAANPGVTANTALLVRKVTDTGGRQGRGRLFLPGIPTNQVDSDGVVHGGFLDTAHADFQDFLAKLGAIPAPMALLHGEHSPSSTPHEVLDLVPSGLLATQRRRLRP